MIFFDRRQKGGNLPQAYSLYVEKKSSAMTKLVGTKHLPGGKAHE
jgi:hypothetical protein